MEALNGINTGGVGLDVYAAFSGGERGTRNSSRVSGAESRKNTDATGLELTPEKQEQIRKLQQRDQEVRAHEQAHINAAGGEASAPTYEFEVGPDGRQYAVGGEVQVKMSSGNTPEETIENARRVQSAASAPVSPSSTDTAVVSEAAQMESQARKRRDEERASDPSTSTAVWARAINAYQSVQAGFWQQA